MTVDLHKRDSEIKILLGLIEQETRTVCQFHSEASANAEVTRRPGIGDVE